MAAKVVKEDREKSATLSEGRFPIKNKAQAVSALKLRGRTRDKAELAAIIRRCMKFSPAQAKKAWDDDKKAGLI